MQIEFKIWSTDLRAEVLDVSGDGRSATFYREQLEASLAGTMLFVECDYAYRRILTWLWQYGLSTKRYNQVRIADHSQNPMTGETIYWIYGTNDKLLTRETVLEDKWSGRLLIQAYKGKPLRMLKYVWQDIKKWWRGEATRSALGIEV
jgi:hypothetical protein